MTARALGRFETAAALSHDHAPFVVVVALELRGRPSVEALRGALRLLQERHSMLRVRLAERDGRYRFETDGVPEIPLEVVPRRSAESWREAAEAELNRRLDDRTGPLARVLLLEPGEEAGQSELLLTFHHSIVDAPCVGPLVDELLSRCVDGGKQAPPPTGSLAPADQRLPPRFRGLSGAGRLLLFVFRQGLDELVYRLRRRGPRLPEIAPSRCRALSVALPAEATTSLVRATRRHRVTLKSAVDAAFLLTVRRHLRPARPERVPLRYMTFADLRPYLDPPAPPQDLGAFVSMLRHTLEVGREEDFWSLARRCTRQVEDAFRRGDKVASFLLSDRVLKRVLRQRRHRMAAVAVSYLGSMRLAEHYGSLWPLRLHGFVSNLAQGPELTAQAKLFRGELLLDIVYLEADLSPTLAHDLVEEILHRLRRAGDEE